MIVPMHIVVTKVTEIDTTLLVVKLPIDDKGDHYTSVVPLKVRELESQDSWADALALAMSTALSEMAGTWGAANECRKRLLSGLATDCIIARRS